jgi:hypothetical protein
LDLIDLGGEDIVFEEKGSALEARIDTTNFLMYLKYALTDWHLRKREKLNNEHIEMFDHEHHLKTHHDIVLNGHLN